MAGVAAANPDAVVMVEYASEMPDFSGFNAPDRGREIAQSMYEKGADIVAGVERCQDELSSPTEEQPATSMDSHGGGYDATASSQAGPDPVDDVDPEDDEKEL